MLTINQYANPPIDVAYSMYLPRNIFDSVLSEIKPEHFELKKREKGYEFRLNKTAIRWIPEKRILYTYKWIPERRDSLEYLTSLFHKHKPINISDEECDSF